jgi:hypothetical protein
MRRINPLKILNSTIGITFMIFQIIFLNIRLTISTTKFDLGALLGENVHRKVRLFKFFTAFEGTWFRNDLASVDQVVNKLRIFHNFVFVLAAGLAAFELYLLYYTLLKHI